MQCLLLADDIAPPWNKGEKVLIRNLARILTSLYGDSFKVFLTMQEDSDDLDPLALWREKNEESLEAPPEAAALWLLGVIRRDLGAATLFGSAEFASLTPIQYTVATTLIILFIPCIAAILIMGKERGIKKTLLILVFIFFYSILISGLLNFILHLIFGW